MAGTRACGRIFILLTVNAQLLILKIVFNTILITEIENRFQ